MQNLQSPPGHLSRRAVAAAVEAILRPLPDITSHVAMYPDSTEGVRHFPRDTRSVESKTVKSGYI